MGIVRNEVHLNTIIQEYLKRKSCYVEDRLWIIKKSSLGGFGIFAERDIQAGEIIFIDSPVLLGPRCVPDIPIQCTICYRKINLITCNKNCHLTICNSCVDSDIHSNECNLIRKLKTNKDFKEGDKEKLTKCLTPLRSLILNEEDLKVVSILKSHRGDQHGKEVDILTEQLGLNITEEEKKFMYFVCTVLDANAFEVLTDVEDNMNSVRGLYPLGSLANHSCFPNAFHVFGEKHKMIVRAGVFIPKNSEIFHAYTRLLWGTITRKFHLKNSKHFICKCERCMDPTEFGTYMTAIYCEKCKGNLLPQKTSSWQCEICNSKQNVGRILTMIGSVLNGFEADDFDRMHTFLNKKLPLYMPQTNQVAVELKYKIIWILGYRSGYLWENLPSRLILLKKRYCQDILELIKKLRTGKCKTRGLLCYELYLCNKELKSRDDTEGWDGENITETYLLEAVDILKYDIGAPDLIKEKKAQLNGY
ncbi:SET domain-containing protein SmydA-8-like isoform X2 [Diorhabda carinulata]|uniref:SET domain-containing protein SmydA-8-like isoform X2 n=1 Tax=Diorhabda carinulata TaxID=1163345 RepID=UPI0025A22B87|nr:SET domain-containing protein SmydA-8-like isoform X2 [Diorhabda carinulata]